MNEEPCAFGAVTSPRGKLPLVAMEISARVTGLLYNTHLKQAYRNFHPDPLEATYIFPLPPRAAVVGYSFQIGCRTIEGVLQGRTAARKDYQKAIEAGRTASIAEQERPDIFTVRVGNIAPGETVSVTLELEGPLALEGELACFRFPLVVSPKYITGDPIPGPQLGSGYQKDTHQVPDASRISPPLLLPGLPNPVHLSIDVFVDPAGLKLAGLTSSLHQVDIVTYDDGCYRVVLGPSERLNRDFVLNLHLTADELEPSLLVSDDWVAMLTMVPPFLEVPQEAKEVVILLDRSGSMNGWKMRAARRAAIDIVESLTPRDRFQVVAFNTHLQSLDCKGLLPASDLNRAQAVSFIQRIAADGGTELAHALAATEDLPPNEERNLVLITDAAIGDHDGILRWARNHPCRIFSVGIDQASSQAVLQQLAELSGGISRWVASESRLEQATTDVHRALGGPVLRDVHLRTPGLLSVISSSEPSPRSWDVYPGQPAVFLSRLRMTPWSRLEVAGTLPDGRRWSRPVPLRRFRHQAVTRTWARAHLLDLEADWAAGRVPEKTIENFSLRYGVLSRFTAFLSVDESRRVLGDTLRRWVQPVEAPQGWAGGSVARKSRPAVTDMLCQRFCRKPESVVQLMQVDPICVEVGRALLPALDPKRGALLLKALESLRARLVGELGNFPGVRFRDNLKLDTCTYVVKFTEIEVGRGSVDEMNQLSEAVEQIVAHLEKLVREFALRLTMGGSNASLGLDRDRTTLSLEGQIVLVESRQTA